MAAKNRFHLFTESEKCSILEALEEQMEVYSYIHDFNVKGGINEMIRNLIKELKDALHN